MEGEELSHCSLTVRVPCMTPGTVFTLFTATFLLLLGTLSLFLSAEPAVRASRGLWKDAYRVSCVEWRYFNLCTGV